MPIFISKNAKLYAATIASDQDAKPDTETTNKSNFRIRVAPSDNYKFRPVEKSAIGLDVVPPVPLRILPKTDPLPDLVLAPGEFEPIAQAPHPAFVGNIYEVAILEDGRRVIIKTDTSLRTEAYISEDGKRREFIPNGHYDLHKGVLMRLPQSQYSLTDDTSMLLSIYKGEVINFVPRWGVEAGRFVAYDLVVAPVEKR